MTLTEQQARPRPNWRQVAIFVGLTFGLLLVDRKASTTTAGPAAEDPLLAQDGTPEQVEAL